MRASLQIARFAGIPVRLHWTFGILLIWVLWLVFWHDLGTRVAVFTLSVIGLVFACVVLHEYGHALVARKYGVRTQDILLTPIGGIARMDHMPREPLKEFVIAIAGPLVNVAIAVLIYLGYLVIVQQQIPLFSTAFWSFEGLQPLALILLKLNIILVLFNLIPAFPMDGGRMLRALLSMRFGRLTGTQAAAIAGQALAVGFLVLGLQGNLILALIGVFVFMSARREYMSVRAERRLQDVDPRGLIATNFAQFDQHAIVRQAWEYMTEQNAGYILALDDEQLPVGVIEHESMNQLISKGNGDEQLNHFLNTRIVLADRLPAAYVIFRQMQAHRYNFLVLVENGTIKGLIPVDRLLEKIRKKTA